MSAQTGTAPSTSIWNFTLEDTSPLFTYSPYADGIGITNGWSTYFPGLSGFNNQTGEGSYNENSYHITSLSGASVTLQVYGTAIYLYGYANCSFDVTLDNNPQNTHSALTEDLLYSATDLTAETHYVTLTARPTDNSTQVGFDSAVVSIPLDAEGIVPHQVVYDNSNSTLVYKGSWTTANDSQTPNTTDPMPYHISSTKGDTVSLTFSGASAIAVNGSLNWGRWQYSVVVDGATPVLYNASSFWIVPDETMFFQADLDESTSHTVNVTNVSGDSMTLAINSFTVFSSNSTAPTTSHKNANKAGVIAGPIVGGVVLIVLLVLAFFWWRARRQRKYVLDDSSPSNIIPFNPDRMTRPRNSGTVSSGSAVASGKQSSGALLNSTGPSATMLQTYATLPASSQPPVHAVSVPSDAGRTEDSRLQSSVPRSSQSDLPLAPVRSAQFDQHQYGPSEQQRQPPPAAPPTDVTRLLEMIAERIDRRDVAHDPNGPPPQYQG